MGYLNQKWDPNFKHRDDGLELSAEEREQNETAMTNYDAPIRFDPKVTVDGYLADGFRIFTDPNKLMHHPGCRQYRDTNNKDPIHVYTDGSSKRNGDADAVAGSGIWYGHESEHNTSLHVPRKFK